MRINTFNKKEYIIASPCKNITALVLSQVPTIDQAIVAKELMKIEKEVEQVGFISFDSSADISLRMSGGEFCGNATMCTAVYYAIKNNLTKENVKVCVLDMKKLIDVDVELKNDDTWICKEKLPFAPKVSYIDIDEYKELPIVSLDGISHIIFMSKHYEPDIKTWCEKLSLPALGFMYYDEKESKLTPLVYVKESDTLFWENSCASGSIAVCEYISEREQKNIALNLKQPGGTLKVLKSVDGNLILEGQVKIL